MADATDLSRAGRSDLLRVIAEQQEEIRRLVAPELARKDEQIAELQARMTEMVDAQLSRRVRAFHLKFGHPVNWTPAVPDEEQVRFRLSLIKEEFLEMLVACFRHGPISVGLDNMDDLLTDIIDHATVRVDLPEFVDALADLDYVVEGTRAVFGVDGGPIMNEVQRANMSKDPVYVSTKDAWHRGDAPEGTAPDPAAKPTKPAGWTPPDIDRVIREQGWKP